MSLIKKVDVEKHFAARRAMRLGRMQPLGQLGAAGIKSATKRKRVPAPAGSSHLGTFFSQRIRRLDSDQARFWSEPVAQTAGKPTTVKINTIFLRDGCILPSQFALRQEPFSKGWAEAMGTVATELDVENPPRWLALYVAVGFILVASIRQNGRNRDPSGIGSDSSGCEGAVQCRRAGFRAP